MDKWYIDRWIRLIAGTLILTSAVLSIFHNPNWIWFTMFVGFMFMQSSITKFCPMELILKALGVPESPRINSKKEQDSPEARVAG